MGDTNSSVIIKFDIKAPNNVFESELNTIILTLHEMRAMHEYKQINTSADVKVFNKNIDLIKNSLDNIRIERIK